MSRVKGEDQLTVLTSSSSRQLQYLRVSRKPGMIEFQLVFGYVALQIPVWHTLLTGAGTRW